MTPVIYSFCCTFLYDSVRFDIGATISTSQEIQCFMDRRKNNNNIFLHLINVDMGLIKISLVNYLKYIEKKEIRGIESKEKVMVC